MAIVVPFGKAPAQRLPMPDETFVMSAAALMHENGRLVQPYGALTKPDKSWSKTREQEDADLAQVDDYSTKLGNALSTNNEDKVMRVLRESKVPE